MHFLHLPLGIVCSFSLTFARAQHLAVALAACVAAAFTVGVSVGASSRTVLFAIFFNGGAEADSAQAGRAGAFCIGCNSHFALSW